MINIRLATEKDFERIAMLIPSEEELFLVYPSGRFPLDVAQVKELFEARKDFSVLTYEDKIIGFANLYDYLAGEFCFIGNVFVQAMHRGKGYGKSLVSHMIALAKGYGLAEVRISVFADNTPALLLYTEYGFEIYTQESQENPLGETVILLHLRLSLNKYLPKPSTMPHA